uniref:Zgc:158343 n=1 Tax=Paramormyrops kingsleyae TaxID=1676925 RepID=A0A3B3R6T0_9TELE
MYARSNSLILSISADNIYQEPFAFRTMTRNSEPEIFTFDPTPVQTAQRSTPVRHRKRNTRVMYPSKVRKYLPPAEKSPIKRWLVILCLVVCLQIYSEEAYTEMPGAGDSPSRMSAVVTLSPVLCCKPDSIQAVACFFSFPRLLQMKPCRVFVCFV